MPAPRTYSPTTPDALDLAATLSSLRMGVADPCWRAAADGSWTWATRTPAGDLTLRFSPGDEGVSVDAWGEAADWAPALLPGVLGVHDHPERLQVDDGPVADLVTRFPGFRLARSARVVDAATMGVCRRGVSSFEAGRSWSLLVETLGDDAPGPTGLRLPPAPRRLAAAEPYELHVLGLERQRADEVRRIASHAPRLELVGGEPSGGVVDRLRGIAGLGADAVDHARSVALGAPDALPVIDAHHRAALVALLTVEGRAESDVDALLEAHRAHRGRVVRLAGLALDASSPPGPAAPA